MPFDLFLTFADMIWIILSIFCSVILGLLFKVFEKRGIDSFQAIIFNYATCIACGWLHLGHFPIRQANFDAPWMPYALWLGLVFITGFNGVALTVRYFGVTISQIMQKMSILITVPYTLLVWQESAGFLKITGILLALVAIILVNLGGKPQNIPIPKSTAQNTQSQNVNRKSTADSPHLILLIPIITWVLSGILEVLFVEVQQRGFITTGDPEFVCTVFGSAGVLGTIALLWMYARGQKTFAWKNVLGGILLGIPNYGSILFILKGLGSGLEGSVVFPFANVGVIVISTLAAVTLFKELLNVRQWIGIVLAVAAILLISR